MSLHESSCRQPQNEMIKLGSLNGIYFIAECHFVIYTAFSHKVYTI